MLGLSTSATYTHWPIPVITPGARARVRKLFPARWLRVLNEKRTRAQWDRFFFGQPQRGGPETRRKLAFRLYFRWLKSYYAKGQQSTPRWVLVPGPHRLKYAHVIPLASLYRAVDKARRLRLRAKAKTRRPHQKARRH
jgi:hypothetical protein